MSLSAQPGGPGSARAPARCQRGTREGAQTTLEFRDEEDRRLWCYHVISLIAWRWLMADLLIRDVPEDVVSALDARARQLGLSRSETGFPHIRPAICAPTGGRG